MKKKWRKIDSLSGRIVCPYCLKPIEQDELTKEHEPPLSRGGNPDHWFYTCKKCNNEKGSLTAEEYAEWKRLEYIRHGGLSNDRTRHR